MLLPGGHTRPLNNLMPLRDGLATRTAATKKPRTMPGLFVLLNLRRRSVPAGHRATPVEAVDQLGLRRVDDRAAGIDTRATVNQPGHRGPSTGRPRGDTSRENVLTVIPSSSAFAANK